MLAFPPTFSYILLYTHILVHAFTSCIVRSILSLTKPRCRSMPPHPSNSYLSNTYTLESFQNPKRVSLSHYRGSALLCALFQIWRRWKSFFVRPLLYFKQTSQAHLLRLHSSNIFTKLTNPSTTSAKNQEPCRYNYIITHTAK